MKLRDYPLSFHATLGTWPPLWVQKGDHANQSLTGEIGILKEVRASILTPYQRCFLIMEYEGAEYVGCLLFQDDASCKQIYELLLRHRGSSIAQIGDIDISPMVPSKPVRRNLKGRNSVFTIG